MPADFSELSLYPVQRTFFKAGDLCLRDAYLSGDLDLCFALEKSEVEYLFFSWHERGDGLLDRKLVQPRFVIAVVLQLVYNIQRVAGF